MYLAEAFGAVAVVLNFIGYRQNEINHYRLISAFALASVSTHFFLLGAMAAGIGCMLASIRNIVAMKYRHKSILYLFVLLNIGFLLYELFVLQHSLMILIAYASSLIFTVGSIVLQDANQIRRWFVLAEVLGLIFALSVGSIFGSVFNVSNLFSIGLKLWQERRVPPIPRN
ncbi:YgjV family protein [Alteromonas facilis]|uniref:YgjV family protein n=1 Tax=Alteromonas facilis TaxID=2048004 RepID=UPI000C2953ED|nr:YgjV family protein [Alteromonas facilis]